MNDKTKHVILAAVLGLLALPLSYKVGLANSYVAMILFSSVLFFGKEYYDTIKPNPTGFDKMDLVADYLGLMAGFILAFIIHGLIQMI